MTTEHRCDECNATAPADHRLPPGWETRWSDETAQMRHRCTECREGSREAHSASNGTSRARNSVRRGEKLAPGAKLQGGLGW